MKRVTLLLLFSVFAYFLDIAFGLAWFEYVIASIKFHQFLGVFNTLQMSLWIPTMVIYGFIGWFLHVFFDTNQIKWALIFSGLVFGLKFYFETIIFTDHSDSIDKLWVYMGTVIPSLSVLVSFYLHRWLTSGST